MNEIQTLVKAASMVVADHGLDRDSPEYKAVVLTTASAIEKVAADLIRRKAKEDEEENEDEAEDEYEDESEDENEDEAAKDDEEEEELARQLARVRARNRARAKSRSRSKSARIRKLPSNANPSTSLDWGSSRGYPPAPAATPGTGDMQGMAPDRVAALQAYLRLVQRQPINLLSPQEGGFYMQERISEIPYPPQAPQTIGPGDGRRSKGRPRSA